MSNTTAAKTIDDDLYKNSIVIPLLIEVIIHWTLSMSTIIALIVCRLRRATVTATRPLAPFLFQLYLVYHSTWNIICIPMVLTIPEQQRQGFNDGLPPQKFGHAAAILDSFDVVLGYPLLFAAGMAYILQTAQYGIVKRYLESVKMQLFLRQLKTPAAAAEPPSSEITSPLTSDTSATVAVIATQQQQPNAASNHLIRLIRVLKTVSSTWFIGLLLAALVGAYVSLGVVLLILGWTNVIELSLAGSIMNYIAYAILIFLIGFIVVLFFVECGIAIVQKMRDRDSKVSLGRWLLDFALDRPDYARLERVFILPTFIFMIIIAVSSVCDVECSSAELYRTSTVIIHVIVLFTPGGLLVLLLDLCRLCIQRPCCHRNRGKEQQAQSSLADGSTLSETSKKIRTFGEYMRKIIEEKGSEYYAFLRYCGKEMSTENVLCVSDVLALEQMFDQKNDAAIIMESWKKILQNYCERNAPLEMNLSGPVRKAVLDASLLPEARGSMRDLSLAAAEQDQISRIKVAMHALQRAALDNCFDTYTRFNPNHGF